MEDLKEIEKLSDKQIMSLVCSGLSKVCEDLARQTKDKLYKESFKKKARLFNAFAKIHLTADRMGVEKWRKKLIGKKK